jgi:D-lactate dehydrogenase
VVLAAAVLRTVPDLPVKYTGLLFFPGIREACAAIVPLRDAGAAALEIMDRSALASVAGQSGMPPELAGLPTDAAGLLMEFQAAEEDARASLADRAMNGLGTLTLLRPPMLTHEPGEQAALWKVRQGMFPSVGSRRPRSTAVIIEDVAFPVERLADAVDLTGLFHAHGCADAIIFAMRRTGIAFRAEPVLQQSAHRPIRALHDDVVGCDRSGTTGAQGQETCGAERRRSSKPSGTRRVLIRSIKR